MRTHCNISWFTSLHSLRFTPKIYWPFHEFIVAETDRKIDSRLIITTKVAANKSFISTNTMDLLKAEIERKRKATAALIDSTNPDSRVGGTRFIRQSDLVQHRLQQQVALQEALDAKRRRSEAGAQSEGGEGNVNDKDSHGTSNNGDNSTHGAAITVPGPSAQEREYANMSDGQVRTRLRQLGKPVALFGESNTERVARLSEADREKVSNASNEVYANEFRLTAAGHGSNGVLGSPGENDGGDNDDEDEDDHSHGSETKEAKSYEFVPTHFSDDKSLPRRKVIYKYFRFLLKSWEWDLNKRPEQEKRVVKGKMETKMQKQCRDYIRHLFKLCKKDEIPPDIEDKLFRVRTL